MTSRLALVQGYHFFLYVQVYSKLAHVPPKRRAGGDRSDRTESIPATGAG